MHRLVKFVFIYVVNSFYIQSRSRVWLGVRASKPAFVPNFFLRRILLIKEEDEKEYSLKKRDEKESSREIY